MEEVIKSASQVLVLTLQVSYKYELVLLRGELELVYLSQSHATPTDNNDNFSPSGMCQWLYKIRSDQTMILLQNLVIRSCPLFLLFMEETTPNPCIFGDTCNFALFCIPTHIVPFASFY